MKEVWLPIEGYCGNYFVSNLGRVKRGDRVLKPQKRRHGYLSVWLYLNGIGKQMSVHRLVANAFCDNPNDYDEVNHLNEIKDDNRSENLEWCSRKQNCNHGTRIERQSANSKNNCRSKRVFQFDMNGNFIGEYPSIHEAFRQTGCYPGNIHNCISGRCSHAYGFVWKYAN